MVDIIKQRLIGLSYRNLPTNMDGVNVFFRDNCGLCYAVVLFDMPNGKEYTQQQYYHILGQVENALQNRNYGKVELLSLLCTYDSVEAKQFCLSSQYVHWVVDLKQKRLLIYENQRSSFQSLEQSLESILSQEENKSLPLEIKRKEGTWRNKIVVPSIDRIPICTIIIIVVNILVFLAVEISGSSLDEQHMIDCGASFYWNIVESHEYYRFFTSMFLHFGIEHLFNNMFILLVLGERMEYILGRVKFSITYILSGILASMISLMYNISQHNTYIVAAGASGAIYGVIGALVAVIVLNKGKVADITPQRLVLFLFLSLYSGFVAQNVDNTAHVAGLVCGFIITTILYRRKRKGGYR